MFGDQIKTLRQTHKISQVELARELSVSKQTVSNWENNNIMPSVELLKKIASYFSCSTDYLLEMNHDGLFVDTTGLTSTQIVHIQQIVDDIQQASKQPTEK